MPTKRELWWVMYDRAMYRRDERGNTVWARGGEPMDALHRLLLEVLSNSPELVYRFPEDGLPMLADSNPWHAEPADPELIEQGKLEIYDRLGEALGIGDFPR